MIKDIETFNKIKDYLKDNQITKIDFDDEITKMTIFVFKKVREHILKILGAFNNAKSMLNLITNKEYTYFEEHYDDSLDAYEISVYENVKKLIEHLIHINSISNVLPNSAIEKINLFLKMFKEIKELDNIKTNIYDTNMYDWLENNFNNAKSIYDELSLSPENILSKSEFNKILKEINKKR